MLWLEWDSSIAERQIYRKKKKISLLCSNFVQQFLHMLLHVILLNSHEHPGHTVTLKLLFMFLCVWWRNGRYKAYLYSPSFQERTQVTNRYWSKNSESKYFTSLTSSGSMFLQDYYFMPSFSYGETNLKHLKLQGT